MGRGRKGIGVDVHGNRIRIRFTWDGRRHSENLPLAPTVANLRAAQRLAADIQRQVELGTFDYRQTFPTSPHLSQDPGDDVFASYADRWLRTHLVEKATFVDYRSALRFWCEQFGDMRIPDIKRTDVVEAIACKSKTASAKRVNNMLIPLRQIFQAAVDDELLARSPLERIRNRPHQKQLPDPLTRDEMEQILAHLASRYPGPIHNWFEFAFTTGLRTSEQVAVRWGSVDWQRRTVRVDVAVVRHEDKGTKTHRVRDVDLSDRAIGALQRQKAFTFLRGPDEPIFCDPVTLKSWRSERKQREEFFLPTLKALGIRRRRAYQTRHTFATQLLMAGVNPAYVARQLGHTTVSTLLTHYARWIDGADKGVEARKAADALDGNWSKIGPAKREVQ